MPNTTLIVYLGKSLLYSHFSSSYILGFSRKLILTVSREPDGIPSTTVTVYCLHSNLRLPHINQNIESGCKWALLIWYMGEKKKLRIRVLVRHIWSMRHDLSIKGPSSKCILNILFRSGNHRDRTSGKTLF